MLRHVRRLLFLAAIALAALSPAGVRAEAPQVLGLIATAAPVPLACTAERCAAVLSSFCLQRSRPMPGYGTAYRPAEGAAVRLVVTTPSGETSSMPAPAGLAFAAYDDYTAVRASLPRDAIAAPDAVALALEIGPGVSLLPVPRAGDDRPQTAPEIALATGPLRAAAARFFDGRGPVAEGARLITLLVNALPERGRRLDDDFGGLWERVITPQLAASTDPEGLRIAAAMHERCRDEFNLRRCLEHRHRDLLQEVNRAFWLETRNADGDS